MCIRTSRGMWRAELNLARAKQSHCEDREARVQDVIYNGVTSSGARRACASRRASKATASHGVLAGLLCLVACTMPAFAAVRGEAGRLPNIVVILADDMGYGDVRC